MIYTTYNDDFVLYNVFSNKNVGWDDASLAIEEAIGFLGKALAE